ncbi:hypothetical protein J2W98_004990 [Paenibacillus peoriae]|uniref:Uncharacterized protein n=1 Tax=Paenibacillus peoriae TaxID=59893 RepID=A0ABU1QM16_9BACL|nr:hypothetical protein [Paenibacillus peoriae]
MVISKLIIELKTIKNSSLSFRQYVKLFLENYIQIKKEGKYKEHDGNDNQMNELLSLFLPYY